MVLLFTDRKNSAFIQSSYECKHVPKQTNSKISTPSLPPHQANPPLFHSDQSISAAGQLFVEARRRVFGIWDGIVTSSVCPQAEYPINEWSSLTPVNSPHPLPQSALNQQSSSSSCLSSQRTERTDFGFVGKAGNQPLPHLQPAAFAARPDLGIEAGLDCISYAHFSPLLCIIQLYF